MNGRNVLTLSTALVSVLFPELALADNCSSLSDCWHTAGAAGAAAAGAGAAAAGVLFGGRGKDDDRCAGARRQLQQAEAMLELHDLQMQSLANRYNELYGRLSAMNQEFQGVQAAAQEDWNAFKSEKIVEAIQNILGAFLPIPPDQGSISAAQSVIGFYQFYQANTGTIAQMRAWALQQGGMSNVLRMLDQMDAMHQVMGRMVNLQHDYDEMEINRKKLEESVADARRQLEECLAAS